MANPKKHSFFYRNGLSIIVLAAMLLFWIAQALTGWHDYNSELQDHGQAALTFAAYLRTGHFMSATFENWESEFLQMAIYVVLTVHLRQKGSSESRPLKGEEGADDQEDELTPKPDSPWPVRRGGWHLKLYSHSLSIMLCLLFVMSFCFHFWGSLRKYNAEQALDQKPPTTAGEYIGNAHFWFESFQNWQSEFLAVAAIVLLSIWLREKGSPESKQVNAPHYKTGG